MKKKYAYGAILALIILSAFILRVTGIGFPAHHFDENVSMKIVLRMVQNNSLNSHSFIYPQQPWFYLTFIVYKIYTFIVFLLKGKIIIGPAAYHAYMAANLHQYYVLSRLLSVCFSVASVYLAYRIVLLLTGNNAGACVAAAILAAAPLPNYFTKYFVRVEEMAIPFVLLTVYLLLKYAGKKEKRYLYYCAALSGFTISIKWPFVLIVLPLFVVFFRENPFRPAGREFYRKTVIALFLSSLLMLGASAIYSMSIDHTIKPLARKMIYSKLLPQHSKYLIVESDKTRLVEKSLDSVTGSLKKLFFISTAILFIAAAFMWLYRAFAIKLLGALFDRTTIGLFAATVLSFLIVSPFVVMNPFLVMYQISRQWWGNLSYLQTLLWYMSNTLTYGIGGIVLAVLSAIGFFAVLSAGTLNTSKKIALTMFPVAFFLYLCSPGLCWDRWMLPIIPFQAMYIAYLAHVCFSVKGRGAAVIALKVLVAALLVFGLYQALRTTIYNDHLFLSFDQHQMTKFWIKND